MQQSKQEEQRFTYVIDLPHLLRVVKELRSKGVLESRIRPFIIESLDTLVDPSNTISMLVVSKNFKSEYEELLQLRKKRQEKQQEQIQSEEDEKRQVEEDRIEQQALREVTKLATKDMLSTPEQFLIYIVKEGNTMSIKDLKYNIVESMKSLQPQSKKLQGYPKLYFDYLLYIAKKRLGLEPLVMQLQNLIQVKS